MATVATLRLMVFNTQHASPHRAVGQAVWIAGDGNADVVVLTEVGAGPGGEALIRALADFGYATVVAPRPADADYRAVLASRGPHLTPVASGIEILPHRGPAAVMELNGHTVGLMGLYVPSRGPRQRRNQDKRAFQQQIAARAAYQLKYKDGPDTDGYQWLACPALGHHPGLICPLRETSLTPRDRRPKVLQPPQDPPKVCHQTAITIPPDVGARYRQDLPTPARPGRPDTPRCATPSKASTALPKTPHTRPWASQAAAASAASPPSPCSPRCCSWPRTSARSAPGEP